MRHHKSNFVCLNLEKLPKTEKLIGLLFPLLRNTLFPDEKGSKRFTKKVASGTANQFSGKFEKLLTDNNRCKMEDVYRREGLRLFWWICTSLLNRLESTKRIFLTFTRPSQWVCGFFCCSHLRFRPFKSLACWFHKYSFLTPFVVKGRSHNLEHLVKKKKNASVESTLLCSKTMGWGLWAERKKLVSRTCYCNSRVVFAEGSLAGWSNSSNQIKAHGKLRN